jgi:hypothetical protein
MRLTKLAVLFLVVACTAQDKAKAPEAAPAVAPPAEAPAFSLAAAAGTWDYVAKSATGDTVLVKAVLTATADPAGWTILLPGRPAQPIKLTISGDSVTTAVGPYESVLRKGVKVTTDGVLRMTNGKLVGTSMAHYTVKGPDSVRKLIIEATRKP